MEEEVVVGGREEGRVRVGRSGLTAHREEEAVLWAAAAVVAAPAAAVAGAGREGLAPAAAEAH